MARPQPVPATTAEQLDRLSAHPTAKLILEYACRTPPRDIPLREVMERFNVSRHEAELAFRQLRSGKPEFQGLTANPIDGSLIHVPLSSPARAIYGRRVYVQHLPPESPDPEPEAAPAALKSITGRPVQSGGAA